MPLISKQTIEGYRVGKEFCRRTGKMENGRTGNDRRCFYDESDERRENDDYDDVVYCCLPSGCLQDRDVIRLKQTTDAVKVHCSDKNCRMGQWMHADCFLEWEEQVLEYLCSSSRARNWNEKQKLQNIWTKKGYDLVYKACTCKCGRGYLRRDLRCVSTSREDIRQTRKQSNDISEHQQQQQPPTSVAGGGRGDGSGGVWIQWQGKKVRRSSLSSSASSSPSSTGSTPPSSSGCGPGSWFSLSQPMAKFFSDADQAATGNIFSHRTDLSAFDRLPRRLRNGYNIRTEDDGPHGTDETRSFVLTTLSAQNVTTATCVVCRASLTVYDKFPIIDGTFFLSPSSYDHGLQVSFRNKQQYLDAICMMCMNGVSAILECQNCQKTWNGSALVIGSMYTYDVFAAAPCCPARLSCNRCQKHLLPAAGAGDLPFYSDYSRRFDCHHCQNNDHHFVKDIRKIFFVVK